MSRTGAAVPSFAAQKCGGKGQVVSRDVGLVVAMVDCCLEPGTVDGRWIVAVFVWDIG